jgi:hypothetical protein
MLGRASLPAILHNCALMEAAPGPNVSDAQSPEKPATEEPVAEQSTGKLDPATKKANKYVPEEFRSFFFSRSLFFLLAQNVETKRARGILHCLLLLFRT